MAGMGNAMMGTGEAEGEGRAVRAADDALCNPLLGELSVKVGLVFHPIRFAATDLGKKNVFREKTTWN